MLEGFDGFFEEFTVEVEADGADVSRLLHAENITSAADLEVAHGEFHAATVAGGFDKGAESFLGDFREHLVFGCEEVGIGRAGPSADAATDLVEVTHAKGVGFFDDDGVGIGDVDAIFDDGGGNEDVDISALEGVEDIVDGVGIHLPVDGLDLSCWEEFLKALDGFIDALDAVVDIEPLAIAGKLSQEGVLDEGVVVFGEYCLNRQAVLWWGVDDGHLPGVDQREVEGAWNRCGRQGEAVDVHFEFFEFLFGAHTEALLFVNDDETEVFEVDVGADEAMGADEDVDLSSCGFFEGLFDLFRFAKARNVSDAHGVVFHARGKVFIVLQGEDGGGNEDGDLLVSIDDGLEGGAHGDFCLPVADISADEAVHRLVRGHLFFDRFDGRTLVFGLCVGEGLFEGGEDIGVICVDVPAAQLAFSSCGEEVFGITDDRFLGRGFGALPLVGAELVEGGERLVGADIAADEV